MVLFPAATRQDLPPASIHGRLNKGKICETGKKKDFSRIVPEPRMSVSETAGLAGNCSGYLSPADIMCIQLQQTIGLLEQKMCLIINNYNRLKIKYKQDPMH